MPCKEAQSEFAKKSRFFGVKVHTKPLHSGDPFFVPGQDAVDAVKSAKPHTPQHVFGRPVRVWGLGYPHQLVDIDIHLHGVYIYIYVCVCIWCMYARSHVCRYE